MIRPEIYCVQISLSWLSIENLFTFLFEIWPWKICIWKMGIWDLDKWFKPNAPSPQRGISAVRVLETFEIWVKDLIWDLPITAALHVTHSRLNNNRTATKTSNETSAWDNRLTTARTVTISGDDVSGRWRHGRCLLMTGWRETVDEVPLTTAAAVNCAGISGDTGGAD